MDQCNIIYDMCAVSHFSMCNIYTCARPCYSLQCYEKKKNLQIRNMNIAAVRPSARLCRVAEFYLVVYPSVIVPSL